MNKNRKTLISVISGAVALLVLSWLFFFNGPNLFQGNLTPVNTNQLSSNSRINENNGQLQIGIRNSNLVTTEQVLTKGELNTSRFYYGDSVAVNKININREIPLETLVYSFDYRINTIDDIRFSLATEFTNFNISGEIDEENNLVSFTFEDVQLDGDSEFTLLTRIPFENNGRISQENRFIETRLVQLNDQEVPEELDTAFRFEEQTPDQQIGL